MVAVLVDGVDEQLEVVEWTLELAVELDDAILWQIVRLFAVLAVETLRLALNELHEAATLAAPAHRLAHSRQ